MRFYEFDFYVTKEVHGEQVLDWICSVTINNNKVTKEFSLLAKAFRHADPRALEATSYGYREVKPV